MNLKNYNFSSSDLALAQSNIQTFSVQKGEIFYNDFCYGFVFVKSGELKVFATQNSKEIALFSLKSGDECLICADCLNSFGGVLRIEVAQSTTFESLPSDVFKGLKDKYPLFANHILSLLATRFASSVEVMSTALFTPLKTRILDFLKTHATNNICTLTHEQIANELGSAREAISRVLKELENSKILRLERSKITLL